MHRVTILTGGRGVGKSTVCRRATALARRSGYACRGIITLAHDGVRDVMDVQSGRHRRLTIPSGEGHAVMQGRYRFDPQTLRWGGTVLSQATPCDLLVIDEVGPLELVRGKGWASAFDILQMGGYALALLVVRPGLIEQASSILTGCSLEILTVTRENRHRLPVSLVGKVGQET